MFVFVSLPQNIVTFFVSMGKQQFGSDILQFHKTKRFCFCYTWLAKFAAVTLT